LRNFITIDMAEIFKMVARDGFSRSQNWDMVYGFGIYGLDNTISPPFCRVDIDHQ
jgi:hypothetical protein